MNHLNTLFLPNRYAFSTQSDGRKSTLYYRSGNYLGRIRRDHPANGAYAASVIDQGPCWRTFVSEEASEAIWATVAGDYWKFCRCLYWRSLNIHSEGASIVGMSTELQVGWHVFDCQPWQSNGRAHYSEGVVMPADHEGKVFAGRFPKMSGRVERTYWR